MPRSAQCDLYRLQRSRNLHKTNLHKLQPQSPLKDTYLLLPEVYLRPLEENSTNFMFLNKDSPSFYKK